MNERSDTYVESEPSHARASVVPFRAEGIGTRIGEAAARLGVRSSAYEVMGVSSATLQRYIAEQTAAAFEPVARLCLAAGVRMEWLATGEGPKLAADAKPGGREPAAQVYRATSHADEARRAPDGSLLAATIRVVEGVLAKHGLRNRATPVQYAELVRIVYDEMERGAAEDAASEALGRILTIARTP